MGGGWEMGRVGNGEGRTLRLRALKNAMTSCSIR